MKIVICVISLLLLSFNISVADNVKNEVEFSKNTSIGEIKVIVQREYWSDLYPPRTLGSQLYINNKLIYKSGSYVGVNKIFETNQFLIAIIEEHQSPYKDRGPLKIFNIGRSGNIYVSEEIDGIDGTEPRYDISKLESNALINIKLETSTGYIVYGYDVRHKIITTKKRHDDTKKLNSRCKRLYKIIKDLDCSDPNLATPMALSREVNYYWLVGDQNTSNRFYKECSRMNRENNILKYDYFKKHICGIN